MRQSLKRRLLRLERYYHIGEPLPDFTAMLEPQPLTKMLQHLDAKKAFALLSNTLGNRHNKRISSDFENSKPGPLTYYVARWAQAHETQYSLGPYVIPEKLADWLLALPDQLTGYRPYDVCWDCGCYYPMFWARTNPAKPPFTRHPWVGRKCLLCPGWIVNPGDRRRLSQDRVDNAPFSEQRKEMESEWTQQVEQVELEVDDAVTKTSVPSPGVNALGGDKPAQPNG